MIDLSHAIQSFSIPMHIDNCDAEVQLSTVSRHSKRLGVIFQSLSELESYHYFKLKICIERTIQLFDITHRVILLEDSLPGRVVKMKVK